MDGKKVAVGVLVVLAILLGGLVANGLRHERAAYGAGSVFATYMAASVEVRENFVNWAVLDTDARRVIWYDMALPDYKLQPSRPGRMLDNDFNR
ncbi:MAG: hypothetical protein ISS74_11190 [Planctomycetes bacterium]|nr:hypothetical protein [Planctomycetota bacterium]